MLPLTTRAHNKTYRSTAFLNTDAKHIMLYLHIAMGIAVQQQLPASGGRQELKDGQICWRQARHDAGVCIHIRSHVGQQIIQLGNQSTHLPATEYQCLVPSKLKPARQCTLSLQVKILLNIRI